MSFAKGCLTYILVSLLILSLLLNFFLTIKHSRKETKRAESKPSFIDKSENETLPPSSREEELIDHSDKLSSSSALLINNTNNTTTNRTTKCPTRFGNFMKPEVFEQEKKRKRLPPNESPIVTLPTFIPMEVKKDKKRYAILNEYWIPKDEEFDLIVLMPTMARKDNGTDTLLTYLNSTIYGYYHQLRVEPDPIIQGKKILFIIQAFVNEMEHELFYELREQYSHVKEFVFFVPPFRFTDPYRDVPKVNYRDPNNPYPGKMARQQTCDIAFLTDFILRNFKFKYLMYTEDDFVPCNNLLKTTFETLNDIEWFYSEENADRQEFDKGFCSLKLATGLGGLILSPVSAEIFLKHIKDNIQLEPIDILVIFVLYSREMTSSYDTCVRRGLSSYVYRKSQLEHIGGISNWVERNNHSKFGNRLYSCGWGLEGGVLWDVGHANKFNPTHRKCPRNNRKLVPCV
ncbi:hypothetical protein NAEGRDRAFT_77797 [Naegleria gruberi]|uniref:Uncharacterized protein n=1 Tax=Naegleria gruberi TaxID=5762 RepID=D2UYH6_NAEGR|nr:uncharacterized protein NAEGRDRAFT_77797 [Naegleria gruberi]EFC50476.1 hypothetical protein NAEGRDRAFT_77797 [Naegleria gruberi]|eukprot:XP_002683220.1 hypothetical protein NAEGRDRAFT_77797 [Naegleria gruberi strain NEG-M]